MRKKVFFLTAVMFCSLATVQAQTVIDSGTCGANLTWKLTTDSTLTISGSGAMQDYNWISDSYSEAPWYSNYLDIIKTIIIDSGVTTIGNHAFIDCYNLTSVTIGNNVTSIGWSAFNRCLSLDFIFIPNSVITIVGHAFAGCIGLTSVTIGNGVTSIEDYAFQECPLTDIYVKCAVPPSIGGNTFWGTARARLHVPCGTDSLYKAAPGWQNFNIIECKTISGKVYLDKNKTIPYTTGQVFLYKRLSGEDYAFTPFPVAVDSIGSNGEYSFTGVDNGDYLVCAVPARPDSAIYSPTYYGDVVYWDSSIVVTIKNEIGLDTIDITLVPFWKDTATGNTRIEGEVVCKGQNAPPPPKDTGISLDKDINGMWQTVAFTYLTLTDSNGTFTFENLPAGKYRVRLNMTGYNADTTLPTAGNSDTFKVRFEIPIPPLSVRTFAKEEGKIKVYPNPTTGQLTITNYELRENTTIVIFDIYGRNVTPLTSHSSPLILDISHLAKGMYFLKVDNKVIKIIKQ